MAERTRVASLLVVVTAAAFLVGAFLFTLARASGSGVRDPGVVVPSRPVPTVAGTPGASPPRTRSSAAAPLPEAPAPVQPQPPVQVDDDTDDPEDPDDDDNSSDSSSDED